MKKYIVEFIGTFFLVLTVVLTENNGLGNFAPLTIGSIFMAMFYAGSHISGGHFNPAVSLAVLIRGKIDRTDFLFYIASQIAGAAFSALIAVFLLQCSAKTEITPRSNEIICALVAEFLGTFALVWVFLNVATARSTAGNSFAGLAIGFTILALNFGLKNVSGGIFNPAVAVGNLLAGTFFWKDLWIYWLASFLGAAGAATIFQVVYGIED